MAQDEELNRYMALAEYYKEQLSQLDMQLSYLQQAINEYTKSKMTIKNISEKGKDSEVLIPIGGASYINAKVNDPKKILFDIGSGYIVEKGSEDATKKIDDRIEELEKNMKKLGEMRQQTQNQAEEVYQKAQELYEQQNG